MSFFPSLSHSLTQASAILPSYQDRGDCTLILWRTGDQEIIPRRTCQVIRDFAREQAIDLTALRQQVSFITGQALLFPLPLSSNLLLVPLKTRIPRIPRDPTAGYINWYALEDFQPHLENDKEACQVRLAGGHSLTSLWTHSTVQKQFQHARLAAAQYPLLRSHPRDTSVPSAILPIAQKMVEVFQEILQLRQTV